MSSYDEFKAKHPDLIARAEAELEVTEEIERLRDQIKVMQETESGEKATMRERIEELENLYEGAKLLLDKAGALICSKCNGRGWVTK